MLRQRLVVPEALVAAALLATGALDGALLGRELPVCSLSAAVLSCFAVVLALLQVYLAGRGTLPMPMKALVLWLGH